jgi:DNA-binding phage protein
MSRIASEAGLGRESLYKALNSQAKPRFDTILRVLGALGVDITFSPKSENRAKRMRRKRRLVPRTA